MSDPPIHRPPLGLPPIRAFSAALTQTPPTTMPSPSPSSSQMILPYPPHPLHIASYHPALYQTVSLSESTIEAARLNQLMARYAAQSSTHMPAHTEQTVDGFAAPLDRQSHPPYMLSSTPQTQPMGQWTFPSQMPVLPLPPYPHQSINLTADAHGLQTSKRLRSSPDSVSSAPFNHPIHQAAAAAAAAAAATASYHGGDTTKTSAAYSAGYRKDERLSTRTLDDVQEEQDESEETSEESDDFSSHIKPHQVSTPISHLFYATPQHRPVSMNPGAFTPLPSHEQGQQMLHPFSPHIFTHQPSSLPTPLPSYAPAAHHTDTTPLHAFPIDAHTQKHTPTEGDASPPKDSSSSSGKRRAGAPFVDNVCKWRVANFRKQGPEEAGKDTKSAHKPRVRSRDINGFIAFTMENRARLRQENPFESNQSILKMLGRLWRECDTVERKRYNELAKNLSENPPHS